MMFEHSIYTVASPEACAAILWKDAGKSAEAAEALKITAYDLTELGILDQMLPEPLGGAHSNPLQAAATLKEALVKNLAKLSQLSGEERRALRYKKFRSIGQFSDTAL
jgi:acetyl-CoA carboxylase carboxyl transferase subunit alpha